MKKVNLKTQLTMNAYIHKAKAHPESAAE